jgi:hypothetical protein
MFTGTIDGKKTDVSSWVHYRYQICHRCGKPTDGGIIHCKDAGQMEYTHIFDNKMHRATCLLCNQTGDVPHETDSKTYDIPKYEDYTEKGKHYGMGWTVLDSLYFVSTDEYPYGYGGGTHAVIKRCTQCQGYVAVAEPHVWGVVNMKYIDDTYHSYAVRCNKCLGFLHYGVKTKHGELTYKDDYLLSNYRTYYQINCGDHWVLVCKVCKDKYGRTVPCGGSLSAMNNDDLKKYIKDNYGVTEADLIEWANKPDTVMKDVSYIR